MVSRQIVERQLHRIGFNPFAWGRSEVRELCNIMMDGEEVIECVNGEYSNGFALLAATNHRVLLVDKKPFLYLTVEDVRFEQISDFNFRNRFVTATLTICTSNKTMHFTSYNKRRLRKLIHCVQKRVVDMRQHQAGQAAGPTEQPAPAAYAPVGFAAVATERPDAPPLQTGPGAGRPPGLSMQTRTPRNLVTYTRDKLPSFHRHVSDASINDSDQSAAGYPTGSLPDYDMPV